MMVLEVDLGDGSVERLEIEGSEPVYIGRDASCDVVFPSPDVSRRHLAVRLETDTIEITDSSANGTFVGEDGEPLHNATMEVPPDTTVRVGPYSLRISVSGIAAGGGAETSPEGETFLTEAGPTVTSAPPDEARARNQDAQLLAASVARLVGPLPDRAPKSSEYGRSATAGVPVELRRRLHRDVLEHLDLANLDRAVLEDGMRPRVREALTTVIRSMRAEIPEGTDVSALIEELTHEALGLGPLEVLLADELVSEIMVVDPTTIFIERQGQIEETELRFTDDDAVRSCIERIVTPLGRRIDESTPLVDARLQDGSRVNAVIPPLALRGPCITIRKFKKNPLSLEDLIRFGTLTDRMARFLARSVIARKNIVISGGTGSGKTTLLNVLSSAIPEAERVVTIEDAAELRLVQPHVVSLEARPSNMEGKGEISIRDLVKNALRMRPDRIVVGECRGGEALDMLQAMNTGHDGSMTTTHANSPREALGRLETLALMSGLDLPSRAIREQLAASVHLIVQQTRFSDGSRRITSVAEVTGIEDDGSVGHREIFSFYRLGTDARGKIEGEFRASGYLPSFVDEFIAHGLVAAGDYL